MGRQLKIFIRTIIVVVLCVDIFGLALAAYIAQSGGSINGDLLAPYALTAMILVFVLAFSDNPW